jgi:hypothetical protein
MRAPTHYCVMTISAGLLLTGIAAEGCGSTATAPPIDAGSTDSATSDVKVADSGSPVVDSGAADTTIADTAMDTTPLACSVDASLNMLNVPDASLGADASVGLCLGCATANCMTQETACNADCMCKVVIVDLVACLASGMSVTTCAAPAFTEPNALALGECLLGSCTGACGVGGLLKDGGGMDGPTGDAPSEAEPVDGASDGPTEAMTSEAGD